MAKQGYIYKYTFPNGKVYIGQTRVSVKDRHYQHMLSSKNPDTRTVCEIAIAKYGEPVCETIETIEVSDNENLKLQQLLDEAEKKWIKHYDCTTRSGKGYNVQEGGAMITPKEFLLQERWYEIFDKDRWGESIACVKEILHSIGEKLCFTGEKLTKEEQSIWYGYKFNEYQFNIKDRETTFSSFYKRNKQNPFLCNIGCVPYEILETIEKGDSSLEEKKKAEQIRDKCYFDNIMRAAVEEHWIEDIRQTIWKQVKKEEKSILREFYKKDARYCGKS